VGLKFEVFNGSAPSLFSTTYSWTKMANIIFLDQPVGSGFSYSKTPIDKTGDISEVKRTHEFLQKVIRET
jgi:serine carboxypeptidase-like clade 1